MRTVGKGFPLTQGENVSYRKCAIKIKDLTLFTV